MMSFFGETPDCLSVSSLFGVEVIFFHLIAAMSPKDCRLIQNLKYPWFMHVRRQRRQSGGLLNKDFLTINFKEISPITRLENVLSEQIVVRRFYARFEK